MDKIISTSLLANLDLTRHTYDNYSVSVCVHSVWPLFDAWDCRKSSLCT